MSETTAPKGRFLVLNGQEFMLITPFTVSQAYNHSLKGGTNDHGAMIAREIEREDAGQAALVAALDAEKRAAITAAVAAEQAKHRVVDSVLKEAPAKKKQDNGVVDTVVAT
jgi:hypothetical protein